MVDTIVDFTWRRVTRELSCYNLPMKNFICLFILILCVPAFAANFVMEKDSLCFKNADPELRNYGPMGVLGSKKGVCQGMSGIVSAFHEHAKFSPNKAKMTYNESMVALAELRRYHSGGCKLSRKVEITGYANLNEFCRAQKSLFMANAIDYNADIAVREISWSLDQFLILQDSAITSYLGRLNLHNSVESIRDRWGAGRLPLMLYYSHVVTVVSITNYYKAGVRTKITFGLYDSNYSTSTEYTVHYGSDGMPKSGQKMLWDVTPSRLTTICW